MLDWELERISKELARDIDKKKKTLHQNATLCRLVIKTIDSDGWKKIISPMLDKMIEDIVGGKHNGRWNAGMLHKAKTDEKREYYIGYKQALIDLYNRINNYVEQLPKTERMLKAINENEQKAKVYKRPMLDSPYAEETRI